MTQHPVQENAEKAVIGALLLDNSVIDRMDVQLKPEHFADQTCRQVFVELTRQIANGKPADVITLFGGLQGEVSLDELNELAQFLPGTSNIRRYGQLVIEAAQERALRAAAVRIHDLACEDGKTIQERVDAAQGELAGLLSADASDDDGWVSLYDGLMLHLDVIDARQEGKVVAWPTGLADLDAALEGGLTPGELTIVGARPAMGKTAFAMTVGLHMSQSLTVGMLSMEMSHGALRDRQLSGLGQVSMSQLRRPKEKALDYGRVLEGIESAKGRRWFTRELSGPNINQVRTFARRLKRKHGLDVLLVDYLQLMSGTDSKQGRSYQLEEATRGLKGLAKELDIAIVCLSQVNRKVEERADQMPMLSDLRDSGAIEQDADNCLFLTRPAATNNGLGDEWKHYARLSIAKQRQGQTAEVPLFYEGSLTSFMNWAGPVPSVKPVAAKRGYS
jgi:replicative DNA helicase